MVRRHWEANQERYGSRSNAAQKENNFFKEALIALGVDTMDRKGSGTLLDYAHLLPFTTIGLDIISVR